MKKTTLVLATILASSTACAATFPTTPANGPGFYLGANAGFTYIDRGDQNDSLRYYDNEFISETSDNSGAGFNVHSGYMFNQYIGAELGYTKYGDATTNINYTIGQYNYTYSLYAITLAAKGVYHFTPKWSINGQLGVARMYASSSKNASLAIYDATYDNQKQNKTAPFVALAGGYDLTPHVTLNAGFSLAMGGNNEAPNSSDVGNASLVYGGVDYHF